MLALVCIGITAATELSLNHHLVRQLDGQLGGTSHRSALMYPEPNRPGWRHEHSYYPRPGPGPRFLDAPGQPAGMVAAAFCFLVVLAAVGWAVYEVYTIGHPAPK